ncbi:MAG: helix-turn-helix transcriptional regulator [Ignavibacteria bacterium]
MTKQEELNRLLKSQGVKENWLAEKLGIKSTTLKFLLHESDKFDEDLYEQIKEILSEYQFELSLYDEDATDNYDLFTDEELRIGIGERIRAFAKRKYGTLKKLAEGMEISPQQLQQYISGKREPGSRILVKLLRLGCDINWLLGGSESIESYKIYKLESELRKMHEGYSEIEKIVNKIEHSHKHQEGKE